MNKKIPVIIIILIVAIILLFCFLYPEALASLISIASRPNPIGGSSVGGGGLL